MLAGCALCLSLLFAQDVAPARPEPRGWTAATWGMTAAQVRAAFPAATPIDQPDRDLGALGRLRVSPVELGPARAVATFQFAPDSDRLVSVRLEALPGASRASVFAQLRQTLAEKYGRPTAANAAADRNAFGSPLRTQTVQWTLRYTTIRLTWYDAGDLGIVSVRYSERAPSASL